MSSSINDVIVPHMSRSLGILYPLTENVSIVILSSKFNYLSSAVTIVCDASNNIT